VLEHNRYGLFAFQELREYGVILGGLRLSKILHPMLQASVVVVRPDMVAVFMKEHISVYVLNEGVADFFGKIELNQLEDRIELVSAATVYYFGD
jgi:hypothetical protein